MDEKLLMTKFDKLNRKMRRYFDGFFAELPLTGIQALVLQYIIVESENRDIFTKDLEEFLGIKGPSVTSLINNLVRSGYLRRESLEEDARYKKLVLTNQAQEIKMHWDRQIEDTHAMSGQYAVMLYMDGREIGRTGFTVRD